MKLEGYAVLLTLVFLVSCGSKKTVVRNQPKRPTTPQKNTVKSEVKKEVVVEQEKEVIEEKVPVIKEVIEEKVISTTKEISSNTIDITQAYINKYASIAVVEMHRYKIPASITLAQGVLESGNGRSPLALKSNNHFGIKCHKGWKGKSVRHDDDAIGECFRKYKHPETSYEDHSKFLTSRSRYSSLFKLKTTDYVGWAHGLKKAGYATDPRYPRKLIAIIQKYELYKYDLIKKDTSKSYSPRKDISTSSNSGTSHIIIKGDTLYSLSKKYNTTVEKIKELNGLIDNTLSIGEELVMP